MTANGFDPIKGSDDTRFLYCNGKFGLADLSKSAAPLQLLQGYNRFGSMNVEPKAFLTTWYDPKADNGRGGWRWPNGSKRGFLLEGQSKSANADDVLRLNEQRIVLSHEVEIGPGTLLDRFGQEDTNYFAPFGTPFTMRSLPPSSLNDPYHVYQVLKPLKVTAGPIAPGFEQPGLGTQYIASERPDWLVQDGILRRVGDAEVAKLFAGWQVAFA